MNGSLIYAESKPSVESGDHDRTEGVPESEPALRTTELVDRLLKSPRFLNDMGLFLDRRKPPYRAAFETRSRPARKVVSMNAVRRISRRL